MEFRCPACATSYRVPVHIDQQVRCARCNHVWRIAEADFVTPDEEARDENDVPEAFADPGADDVPADDRLEATDGNSRLAALLEQNEAGLFGRDSGSRQAPETWPEDSEPEDWASPGDQGYAGFGAGDAQDEQARAENGQGNDHAHGLTAYDGESDRDAETLDRRLADNWFSAGGEATSYGDAETNPDPQGGFERIMEGIEDVIAESGGPQGVATDDKRAGDSDDPLRALMSEDRLRSFTDTLEGRDHDPAPEGNDDPWGGKVVRLNARGGDQRFDTGPPGTELPDHEREKIAADYETADAMDNLAGQMVGGHDTLDDDAEDADQAASASLAHQGTSLTGSTPPDRANVEALRADMQEMSHALSEANDPYSRDTSEGTWSHRDDHDEARESARRESLAFEAQDQRFETGEAIAQDENDSLGDYFTTHEPLEEARGDTPAAEFLDEAQEPASRLEDAASTAHDDSLLAEYEFDEEEPEDLPEDFVAERQSGAGTLTVAAAWALFVAVIAGAAVSLLTFREQIAEVLPASAPVYAAVGFPLDKPAIAFENVNYAWQDGSPGILTLKGAVKNTSEELTEIPPLRITIRDDAGSMVKQESQRLDQASLVPGETYSFSLDIRAPGDKLRTVELSL